MTEAAVPLALPRDRPEGKGICSSTAAMLDIINMMSTPCSTNIILMSHMCTIKAPANPPVWKDFLNGFNVFECFEAIPSFFCFRGWHASCLCFSSDCCICRPEETRAK